jgi:peptidoglycan/xylan/chitin deacetylase (PgdA/CDA1 family)
LKLEALARLFRDAFGHDPTSFRAGRWSASGRTARLLSELGYVVDSSVSPRVHWSDGGRWVDYRNAPDQPYRPGAEDLCRSGDLPLWELPVSIVRERWRRPRPTWLRPSVSTVGAMQRVIGSIRRRHPPPRTFVAMLHNSELSPGTSPYSRDREAATRVGGRLESLVRWALDEGMCFTTLTEAARSCSANGSAYRE